MGLNWMGWDGMNWEMLYKGSDTRGLAHGFRNGHGRINAGMYICVLYLLL